MTDEVNGSIRYSAKELFEKIDGKLDAIDSKLDDKIGRTEFEELKTRVHDNENLSLAVERKVIRYAAIGSTVVSAAVIAANYFLS